MSRGMIADIEFDSVTLRKLGQIRYDLYAAKTIITKKAFVGDVFINPVAEANVSNNVFLSLIDKRNTYHFEFELDLMFLSGFRFIYRSA